MAQELDGLLQLKPALGQYLIYGPVPGTPFNERVRRDHLMLPQYEQNPALLYRRADGFATVMKHPTLSPGQIVDLQRWCFEEDFQRLGPSIFRVLEARLLGYRRLKDSPNPALREKAAGYADDLRCAYPVFLAGRWFGPNRAIRRWIGELEKQIIAELGAPTWGQRAKSMLAIGAAAWTAFTLKFDLFQHPRLIRTAYRLPRRGWKAAHLWEELPAELAIPDLQINVELQHARRQVWLRLEIGRAHV